MEPEMDVCPYCGHKRKWDLWVLAHWSLRLEGKCEECGNPYSILNGRAIITTTPKKKTRAAR